MAKVINYWYGSDTYGRNVEVAQRKDGVYFSRYDYQNGRYGLAITKWSEHKPTFETSTKNVYSGEITHHPDSPVMTWGFQRMTKLSDTSGLRLRLPN